MSQNPLNSTTTFTITGTGIATGGAIGTGGATVWPPSPYYSPGVQPTPYLPNTFPSYPPTPVAPSLEFQVDMIFAAVEKHLRKLIREELDKDKNPIT